MDLFFGLLYFEYINLTPYWNMEIQFIVHLKSFMRQMLQHFLAFERIANRNNNLEVTWT